MSAFWILYQQARRFEGIILQDVCGDWDSERRALWLCLHAAGHVMGRCA